MIQSIYLQAIIGHMAEKKTKRASTSPTLKYGKVLYAGGGLVKEHKNAGGETLECLCETGGFHPPQKFPKPQFIFLYINIYIKGALPVCVWSPGVCVQCPYIQSKSRGAESMYCTSE